MAPADPAVAPSSALAFWRSIADPNGGEHDLVVEGLLDEVDRAEPSSPRPPAARRRGRS
jgi:hypothetical protein